MIPYNNQQLNTPLHKEVIDFVRGKATNQECAYLDRFTEKVGKGNASFEDSQRFTDLASKYGYFESSLFYDHLSEMQPFLSRLISEIDEEGSE